MKINNYLVLSTLAVSCSRATTSTINNNGEQETNTSIATSQNTNISLNSNAINTQKRFSLDDSITNKISYWRQNGPISNPFNTRRSVVFGKKIAACSKEFGLNKKIGNYNYPVCDAANSAIIPKGASYEGSIIEGSVTSHLLHTESSKNGTTGVFMSGFDSTGQNGLGNNAYIHALYSGYTIDTNNLMMQPWSEIGTDPKAVFRSKQRVKAIYLPDPSKQQLQQNLRFVIGNKACLAELPKKLCKLELNFKAFLKGVNVTANPATSDAQIMFDPVQGGMPAVLIPFNTKGQVTKCKGKEFGTSWGEGTKTDLSLTTNQYFQTNISWTQFTNILTSINSNPAETFGAQWNNKLQWYLFNAGYGQENYNKNSANYKSIIEGIIENVQVIAVQ